jgi:hypothetical protein
VKIRAYLVTTDGRTDPIQGYLMREDPPMGADAWRTSHYARDATTGVVFVRYDPLLFDPAVLEALPGVTAIPPEKADRPYAQMPPPRRNGMKALLEQRGGTVDEGKLVTWEDALCELMRRNGSPEQTTLRATPSQRTRQWLDEHE